jgi:Holliday junction resolvasome RuvABC endonuclease subunit
MILACDPGLAAFGFAVLDLDGRAVELGVIRTEKSAKKRGVLSTDDNLRRVRELVSHLERLVDRHGVRVIATESMSFPRASSAAAKLAMSWAALATLSELRGLPMLQLSPQEVKKQLCNARNASKDDVEGFVRFRLRGEFLIDAPPSQHNHAFDAAAVGLCVLGSDVVRALRGRAA